MDIFIDLAMYAVLGYLWLKAVNSVADGIAAYRVLKESREELTRLREIPHLKLKCEGHHGVVYCFEEGTDRFICQGKSLEDINNAFKLRFPTIPAGIVFMDEVAKAILQDEIDALPEEEIIRG